jgi:hypothetical protein
MAADAIVIGVRGRSIFMITQSDFHTPQPSRPPPEVSLRLDHYPGVSADPEELRFRPASDRADAADVPKDRALQCVSAVDRKPELETGRSAAGWAHSLAPHRAATVENQSQCLRLRGF